MKNKKNFRKFAIIVIIILAVLYGIWWYAAREKDKLNTSYLIKTNTITYRVSDINHIKDVFIEVPNDYFLYVTYTNNEDVYNYEKKLKKVIDKYKVNDIFYLLDITDIKEEDKYLNKINEALNLDNKVSKTPIIIYYEDNEFKTVINDLKELENILKEKDNDDI